MEKYRWEREKGRRGFGEREKETLVASQTPFKEPQWATVLTGIVAVAGGNRIAVKEPSP